MALPITSFALFSGVVLISGALTVSGLNFTADTVARVAAETPVQTRIKPSYVARLPTAKADDFNAAKTVPVKPATLTVKAKAPEPAAPAAVAAPTFTHKVAVDSARVRSGPKKSFGQVYSLQNGSPVSVSETVNGWAHIKDDTGRDGWVHASLLQPSAPAAAAVAQAQ